MKQMYMILIVLGLAVMAAGWVYLSQQDFAPAQTEQAQSEAQATIPAAPEEPVAPEKLSLRQEFENLLNAFLQEIADKTNGYKNERRVLAELTRPSNLKTEEYVDQNYQIMKETVPALHQKIDEVMKVFEDTEGKVRTLLEGQAPELQEPILKEWDEMKRRQANMYVEFFKIEEQILQAYEELMTVYYNKKGSYSYDEATGKLVFANPDGEAPVTEIRARLMGYVEDEARLLKDGQPQ